MIPRDPVNDPPSPPFFATDFLFSQKVRVAGASLGIPRRFRTRVAQSAGLALPTLAARRPATGFEPGFEPGTGIRGGIRGGASPPRVRGRLYADRRLRSLTDDPTPGVLPADHGFKERRFRSMSGTCLPGALGGVGRREGIN